jgi:hypothetical protein
LVSFDALLWWKSLDASRTSEILRRQQPEPANTGGATETLDFDDSLDSLLDDGPVRGPAELAKRQLLAPRDHILEAGHKGLYVFSVCVLLPLKN